MSARGALIVVVALAILAGAAIVLWPRFVERRAPVDPGGVAAPGGPPSRSAGQDWYEVSFTQPRYPDRPENHRGGVDERLVAFIESAQRSVDVAIYDFDLQNVAEAMARARGRGVPVRMVTDTDTPANKDAAIQQSFATIRRAGIPIVEDKRRAIMHHKFVVVDGDSVLTGSWNFTIGDTYRLNNNAVIIRSPAVAANFTAEFEKMFVQQRFGPTKPKGVPNPRVTIGASGIETHFAAEDDPSVRLVALLRGAQTKIDFVAFSFTHEAIGAAVLERAKAGVKVRGVFETTGSETRFSEYGAMKQAGLEVYQDGNPYVMHHKVFVVDDRYTVFGSFNFSANAAESNDENMVVVDDPGFARTFLDEVDRIVAQAKSPVKARAPARDTQRPE
jgi:phosphatidylserine/phosphatidylglycerophosphate/cardiolipin synthase-like enzyme